MSGGGPPHQPHNRHVPPANSAWNHLQVPSYFPRQPQLAHMQAEHPLLHQPSWHTPTTTDAMKMLPHTHMLNEMFKNEALFPRDCVDLSLTRNGNPNGELPTAPSAISLSVRDTSKINSLPPSMLDIQAMELTKCATPNLKSAVSPGTIRSTSMSPGLKSASPGLISSSPGLKSLSPGRKSLSPGPNSSSPGLNMAMGILAGANTAVSSTDIGKNQKRSNIRVDSILERLNPLPEKIAPYQEPKLEQPFTTTSSFEKNPQTERPPSQSQSVIVQAAGSYDENSNSSGTTNVPTPTNTKEDDSGSMHSNEDSLDSTKSRRKRKPSKTIRVTKEEEIKTEGDKVFSEVSSTEQQDHKDPIDDKSSPLPTHSDPATIATILEGNGKLPENRQSSDELDAILPAKTRRKASSESETIDNIAAMVQEGLKEKEKRTEGGADIKKEEDIIKTTDPIMSTAKPVTVSVIKTKENLEETLSSDVQSNVNNMLMNAPPSVEPNVASVVTPAQKKASITQFVEVENKLEEMFAGIVEDHVDATASNTALETLKNDSTLGLADDSLLKLDDSVTSTSQEISTSSEVTTNQDLTSSQQESSQETSSEIKTDEKKPVVKKARRSRPPSRRDSDQDGETPAKKKKFTKTKVSAITSAKKPSRSPTTTTSKYPKKTSSLVTSCKTPTKTSSNETVKDVYAYDSGSNASSSKSKGPFVQIRGPRDSPLSVSVVNTPLTGDEDGERKPLKNKKFHDDSEYRHKVRSKGLHCSTLSNKYDAERKDTSWICAFCKRGPHASELTGPSVINEVPPPGDLFGPYFITANCPEFEKRLDDPYDRQFKSKKIGKVLDEASATTNKSGKKAKRKSESIADPGDTCLGITDTGNNTYEVWAHEDCLVWSPGIYLVGPKIAGLEEAVWTCSNISCSGCGLRGANISCLKRGCLSTSHVCCARKIHWQLHEDNFTAYCPLHSL